MNWKDELNKKEKELNLKEAKNVDSRLNNRNSSGGISSLRLSARSKEINNKNLKEGGNKVITVEAALSDLDKLIVEAQADGDKVSMRQAIIAKVLIKFLSTIRSNQLLTDEDRKRIAGEKAERKATEKK